jgi:hypothetical protein
MSFVENYWFCNQKSFPGYFYCDERDGPVDPFQNQYETKKDCQRISKICRDNPAPPRPTPRPFERCDDCNLDECAREQCDPSTPFMCVSGPANGGCAADPNF